MVLVGTSAFAIRSTGSYGVLKSSDNSGRSYDRQIVKILYEVLEFLVIGQWPQTLRDDLRLRLLMVISTMFYRVANRN